MIETLKKAVQRPQYVLVACQPKSASTFTTNVLSGLPGCRHVRLVPGYDRREQELSETRIKRYRFRTPRFLVSQAHVRNSAPTRALIARYGMRVVVLVRDPLDTVASLRDHIRNEGGRFPFAYFREADANMTDAELELAIARLVMPWVLNFRLSWANQADTLTVSYEEIVSDPPAAMTKIATFAGIDAGLNTIDALCSDAKSARSRFNVGTVGRGQDISAAAKCAVRELATVYPRSDQHENETLRAFIGDV